MASDEQQSAPQLASQAPEQQAADAIASLTLEEREGSAAGAYQRRKCMLHMFWWCMVRNGTSLPSRSC